MATRLSAVQEHMREEGQNLKDLLEPETQAGGDARGF
jgi:hypothetical protein